MNTYRLLLGFEGGLNPTLQLSIQTLILIAIRKVFAVSCAVLVAAGTSVRGQEDLRTTTVATVQLLQGQEHAISLLRQVRPVRPAPVFLFTDPNKDPDDLCVLIASKYLQSQGFVDLRSVLTTLGDLDTRTQRAKFARHVLDELGMLNVTVGVGGEYPLEITDSLGQVDAKTSAGRKKDHNVFVETPWQQTHGDVASDGLVMIKQELEKVANNSAVLLINSGMSDVAKLLQEAPDLMKQKTARVVIMGGVELNLDQRGFVVADKRAYNNTTYQDAANYSYSRVQKLGLPLTVVNREATYSAAVPRSFYDNIAATGHPVGVYLKNQQKRSLNQLWDGINQGHLPPMLTPEWFFQTFTYVDLNSPLGKETLENARAKANDFEIIWNQVSKFNLYDSLALLAATPGAADLLFKSEVPLGAESSVQIIGKNSIKDASLMKDLLAALCVEGLNPTPPPKSRTGTAPGYPPRQYVDEQHAPWTRPYPEYSPPEYTAEVVFQNEGKWADPKDFRELKREFLTRTHLGDVPVKLDEQGRPLNPLGRTGLRGRGLLGRWGRNNAGDPLLTRVNPESGRLELLVIERKDSGNLALPGGMVDAGEDIATTVSRELAEETGLHLDFANAKVLFTGVVDDPRNTDNAWMETTVLHLHLSTAKLSTLPVRAGDDARAVAWVNVDAQLLSAMHASHSDFVRLALVGLRDDPAVTQQVYEVLAQSIKPATP